MRFILAPVIALLVLELSGALPVVKHQTEEPKHAEKDVDTPKEAPHITPHKFDPYDPHIRTAWEEKRREKLQILREYYDRVTELESGMKSNPFKHHEGDPAKLHAAEIAEVTNSIHKLTEELKQFDQQRHELFKQYEMQKKFDDLQKEKGHNMDEEKRKQFHAEQERLKEKQKKHDPLHHPGSKQQLEEVWEKQDHVEQEFDPETFFNLHDLDSNGVWDQDEVKSLFQNELDKMYPAGSPRDDPLERREEMERMREHVFKEADTDRNGLIDYKEFLKQTEEPDFQKDEGWKGLDEQQLYTQEEYDNYLREYHLQQQAAEANANAAANGVPLHPNAGNYYQVPPQQHGDPNSQYHQGQVPHPAQYQNQMPPQQQQQHQGDPNAQYYQGQVPHPAQYQNQMPPQQQQQGGPNSQYHQGQVPHPAQYQNQMPPQQQQQQQGDPNSQYYQGQVPHPAQYQNQMPPQQQYQQQVVPQTYQQPQQQNVANHPNVPPPPPQQQQQQVNKDQLNVQVPPVVQNVQNDAAAQQQHLPNSVEPEKTHFAPGVV